MHLLYMYTLNTYSIHMYCTLTMHLYYMAYNTHTTYTYYTGDNIETAKAIARECGILTADGLAMEGPEFRKLTPAQLDDILPRLQVLS